MKFACGCVLALTLSAMGYASSLDIGNQGGTLESLGPRFGIVAGPSVVNFINGPQGLFTGNLGFMSLGTGALLTGSLQQGGTLSSIQSEFEIVTDGLDNTPKGVFFTGHFSGPITWSLITLANGTHAYTLTGILVGETFNHVMVNGATIQLLVNTGKGFFNGRIALASGDTNLNGTGLKEVVPEPATLTLVGSGLAAFAGMARRKFRA